MDRRHYTIPIPSPYHPHVEVSFFGVSAAPSRVQTSWAAGIEASPLPLLYSLILYDFPVGIRMVLQVLPVFCYISIYMCHMVFCSVLPSAVSCWISFRWRTSLIWPSCPREWSDRDVREKSALGSATSCANREWIWGCLRMEYTPKWLFCWGKWW